MDTHKKEKDTKALEIIKVEPVITKTRLAILLQCSEKTVLRD
jgi:DeoR/GlpR family transcriptional regulator of sugar metabolism